MGCGPLGLLIIIVITLLVIGGNEAVGFYFVNCDDVELIDCIQEALEEEDEEEPEEGTVAATGVYTYKGHEVTITMNIPLKGGEVTGTVGGTCEGKVNGTYGGEPNGAISGSMSGVCAPFFINIPASAGYGGSVNKTAKTVPISFTGKGGGFTHEGSMVLSYP